MFFYSFVIAFCFALAAATTDVKETSVGQRIEEARKWFHEKIYSPVSKWVEDRWNATKPIIEETYADSKVTLEKKYKKVFNDIDQVLGNSTEKVKKVSGNVYEKAKELNKKLGNYWKNDFSWNGLVNNTSEHLKKIDEFFNDAKEISLEELAVEERKHAHEELDSKKDDTLAAQLQERLIKLRYELARSHKVLNEGENEMD